MSKRIWLLIGLTAVLGIGAGAGTAVLRLRLVPWDDELAARAAGRAEPQSPAESRSRVMVDQDEYDFGVADNETDGQHDFVLRNVGNAPLELASGGTTCSCVLSELPQTKLTPGQSTKVTIQWKAKGRLGEYRQSGTILTNDPDKPRVKLGVIGRFTTPARAVPEEATFSQVSADEPAMVTVYVYGYLPELLKITRYELADPSTAKHFEVHFQPIPPAQVSEEPGALNGLLARITVKPGLPLGPIRQTIRLKTNLEKRPTIEVPIRGTVGGEISIVGPGWNAERSLLSLDTVSGQEGTERRLLIIARGLHRKEVRFTPVQIVPDLLKVELGQTIPLGNGEVTQTPLTISIPKGSPPANHLDSEHRAGQITIQTNHPRIRQLRILVSFAIEG